MSESKIQTVKDIPMPLQREIEARIIVPFIEAFAKEIGEEKTLEIASQVISRLAVYAGKQMADAIGDNSLDAFLTSMLPVFGQGGALKVEVKENTPDRVRMDVKECIYTKMYKETGMEKYGTLLSCQRDKYLFEGFNPDIVFKREGTIMEGFSCCDFCLEIKK
jgi:hypothetical protein